MNTKNRVRVSFFRAMVRLELGLRLREGLLGLGLG